MSRWQRLSLSVIAAAVLAIAAVLPATAQAPAAGETAADAGSTKSVPAPDVGDSVLDTQPILEVDPEDPYKAREPEEKEQEPTLLPEGKRLFDREGTIARTGGESLFVFTSGERPMVLLPSKPLERAENLSEFGRKSLTFVASGVVYEYRGRNYLLLEDDPQVAGGKGGEHPPAAGSEPGPAEPAAQTSDGDAPPTDRDAPPDESRLSLPDAQPVPAGRNPLSGQTGGLYREGRRLMDREGRVNRVGSRTLFIFDTGDAPVVLMPNKKLERMEILSDLGRKSMRFRVSGRISEYRGRNYLSMTKLVVIPKAMEHL